MVIYTIGHSNVYLEEIVKLLDKRDIEMVLDARSSPYSRFAPQFNKETLAKSLWKAGIQYDYAGRHRGGRPGDRSCYDGDDDDKVLYREVEKREWYQEAIDRLMEVATDQRTVIMCAEEDPKRCHQHFLIAHTLLDRGIEVQHIRRDGRAEKAGTEPEQLLLFKVGRTLA